MTDDLNLALVDNSGNPKTVVASYPDGETFDYTPINNCNDGYCGLWTGQPSTKSYGGIWYYNFQAAHAHDAAPSANENGSICPKGWKLPYNYYLQADGSYGGLTDSYGITSSGANTSTTTGYQTLIASPLSFVARGYFSGSGWNNNTYPYWSSGNTNIFEWNTTLVHPQYTRAYGYHTYYWWQGYMVRCIASPLVH